MNPKMCLTNCNYDVWVLHRKLVHRFLRYYQAFCDVTDTLVDFDDADAPAPACGTPAAAATQPAVTASPSVICLLSSDSEDADDEDA